jgi:hypothetical protein
MRIEAICAAHNTSNKLWYCAVLKERKEVAKRG